jgi:23S rRNA (cytosine1962-C5)-methyltransferase
MDTRPTVRLGPKIDPRRVKRVHPWIYDNELVLDRRTKSLPPGTIAELEDAERVPLGVVALNSSSRISGRVLDLEPGRAIDRAWFTEKLRLAQALRATLYETPFYRLVHAEGDRLPGLVIDRFGSTAVVQPNAAWLEALLDPLVDALVEVTGATTILKNAQGRARALEGLDEASTVLRGTEPAMVEVRMNGAVYMADLISGQKTGLFYDQRPNHAFAARLSRGRSMLDVFSHVGGFGLAALAGGAEWVLAVDGSAAALDLARQGAQVGGVQDRFETRRGDAFEVMAALAGDGGRFGIVVCDPPAFAPSRKALDAGLRAYEKVARLAAALVEPEGYLVLCSCSHAADLEAFRAASLRGIGRAGRTAQVIATGFAGPDHPQHPALAESGYLKALFFRLLA